MKVLVDECVTIQLLPHLTGHEVTHVVDTTWRGMKNGVLLRLVQTRFDVFLTTDRHIPQQQNLRTFDLALVILRGVSNKLEDLLPLVPDTLLVLQQIAAKPVTPGDVYEIVPTVPAD